MKTADPSVIKECGPTTMKRVTRKTLRHKITCRHFPRRTRQQQKREAGGQRGAYFMRIKPLPQNTRLVWSAAANAAITHRFRSLLIARD